MPSRQPVNVITARVLGIAVAGLGLLPAVDFGRADLIEDEAPVSVGPRLVSAMNNYTDLRLGYYGFGDGSFGGSDGGAYTGAASFDDLTRISIMAIGPVCSIIPVNCFTPPRLGPNQVPSGYMRWGDETGFNFIGGMEFSYNHWSKDRVDAGATAPGIDVYSYALTFHAFGLALETLLPGLYSDSPSRLQFEINPFVGIGYASGEFDGQVAFGDDDGLYFEYGIRTGIVYTFANTGFQIALDARYMVAEIDGVDIPGVAGFGAEIDGEILAGLQVGWRF